MSFTTSTSPELLRALKKPSIAAPGARGSHLENAAPIKNLSHRHKLTTATGRKMMCEEVAAPKRKFSGLRDPRVCETDFCAKAESAFLPIRDELGYGALCEDTAQCPGSAGS